jgi:hypothetical protein
MTRELLAFGRKQPLQPQVVDLNAIVSRVSRLPDDALVQLALVERRAAFIQKPFTPTELLQRIRDVLEHQAPRDPA